MKPVRRKPEMILILRKKAVYQAQSGYDSKTYFWVVLLLPIFIRRNLRLRTVIYLFGNIFFILGGWIVVGGIPSIAFISVGFLESILQINLTSPFLNFWANLLISIVGIAILFKLLPNARVSWLDALIGAGVTATLLTAGTRGFGWYLSNSKFGSFFDAMGAVALLLIAIYFLSQIFIFGAVFTRVFADIYGGGITPLKPVESKHRRPYN